MAEYINREDLLKNLKQFAPEHLTPLIVSLIEKQPTADVAEVVRCKDCKHKVDYKGRVMCGRRAGRIGLEWYGLSATSNDNYCSYGARMDGMDGDME